MTFTRRTVSASLLALGATSLAALPAFAKDRGKLVSRARESLKELEASSPAARRSSKQAHAVLVFPSVLKAGFVFGAQTGDGVLFRGGKVAGYYNLSGGSWGLQIGGQNFAYALFFMTPKALDYLEKSGGWQAGTGPSITVVNKGAAAEVDTTTATHDVLAFPYNGKGLMADLTFQGAKITRLRD
ncbi:MAG: lipid-binding SYLF domain-containing protein [Caulobacteraceae bacterium]